MSLIRKTYNILTVIDKTDFVIFSVAELLNGTDIESTTLSCSKFFS